MSLTTNNLGNEFKTTGSVPLEDYHLEKKKKPSNWQDKVTSPNAFGETESKFGNLIRMFWKQIGY